MTRTAPTMARRRPQQGFTLFEVLVAVFITAVAFSGIYALYESMTDIAGRVQRESVLEDAGRLVLDQLRLDLAGLYLPSSDRTYRIKDDEEAERFLEFVSTSGLDFVPAPHGVNLYTLGYELDEISELDEQNRFRLVRYQKPFASMGTALGEDYQESSLELSDMITRFEFEMDPAEDPVAGLGIARRVFHVSFDLELDGTTRTFTTTVVTDMGDKMDEEGS